MSAVPGSPRHDSGSGTLTQWLPRGAAAGAGGIALCCRATHRGHPEPCPRPRPPHYSPRPPPRSLAPEQTRDSSVRCLDP